MSQAIVHITSDTNDGNAHSAGSFWTNGDANTIGHIAGTLYHAFYTFTPVAIPAGSLATSAIITVVSNTANSTSSPILTIYCNDVDSAVAPTNYSEFNNLALTSGTSWTGLPSWSNGVVYTTVDISSEINEILSRDGWSSGNAITVVIKASVSGGSYYREPVDYHHSTRAPAYITIDYEEAPSPLEVSDTYHILTSTDPNSVDPSSTAHLHEATTDVVILGNVVPSNTVHHHIAAGQTYAELTLPALVCNATGGASANVSLPAITCYGYGGGYSTLTLPFLTMEATGSLTSMSASVTLPALTCEGYGAGLADITFPALTLEGAGAVGGIISADIIFPRLSLTGQISAEKLLGADITFPALTCSGTGIYGENLTGSISFPALTMTATGFADISISAAITLPMLTCYGVISSDGYFDTCDEATLSFIQRKDRVITVALVLHPLTSQSVGTIGNADITFPPLKMTA